MEVKELKRELAKALMRAEAAEALCKELEEENAALRDAVAELEALTEEMEPEPEKAVGWDLADPFAREEERVMAAMAMVEPRLRPHQEAAMKAMVEPRLRPHQEAAMMKALIEEAEFLANMEKKVQLARARGAQDGHLSVRLREGPTMGEFTVEARYGGGEAYITIRGEDLSSHSDRGRSAKIAAVALAYRLNARSITPRLLTSIRKLFEQRAVEAGLAPPPPDYFEARRRPSDKYAAPKPERVKIKRDDPTPRSPKQRGGR